MHCTVRSCGTSLCSEWNSAGGIQLAVIFTLVWLTRKHVRWSAARMRESAPKRVLVSEIEICRAHRAHCTCTRAQPAHAAMRAHAHSAANASVRPFCGFANLAADRLVGLIVEELAPQLRATCASAPTRAIAVAHRCI